MAIRGDRAQLNIRVPRTLDEELEDTAKQQGVSKGDLVLGILQRYMGELKAYKRLNIEQLAHVGASNADNRAS